MLLLVLSRIVETWLGKDIFPLFWRKKKPVEAKCFPPQSGGELFDLSQVLLNNYYLFYSWVFFVCFGLNLLRTSDTYWFSSLFIRYSKITWTSHLKISNNNLKCHLHYLHWGYVNILLVERDTELGVTEKWNILLSFIFS